jgi:hypothetical protein
VTADGVSTSRRIAAIASSIVSVWPWSRRAIHSRHPLSALNDPIVHTGGHLTHDGDKAVREQVRRCSFLTNQRDGQQSAWGSTVGVQPGRMDRDSSVLSAVPGCTSRLHSGTNIDSSATALKPGLYTCLAQHGCVPAESTGQSRWTRPPPSPLGLRTRTAPAWRAAIFALETNNEQGASIGG